MFMHAVRHAQCKLAVTVTISVIEQSCVCVGCVLEQKLDFPTVSSFLIVLVSNCPRNSVGIPLEIPIGKSGGHVPPPYGGEDFMRIPRRNCNYGFST